MKLTFKKTVIYVVRRDALCNYRESAPCIDCMRVLKHLNVKKIIDTCKDGRIAIRTPESYTPRHQTL